MPTRGLSGWRCSANQPPCGMVGVVGMIGLAKEANGMYLRHTTITKRGKSHTYWRLVRSVRHGSKVRQETVAQLGELDAQGRLASRALADRLVGIERSPGL